VQVQGDLLRISAAMLWRISIEIAARFGETCDVCVRIVPVPQQGQVFTLLSSTFSFPSVFSVYHLIKIEWKEGNARSKHLKLHEK